MLAHRIIPVLLKRGDTLVKGQRFQSWRSVGHVEQAARIHQAREVDELCILDIGATPEGRGPDFDAVARLTAHCFMPLTVGGGVRSVEHVRELLRAGADKVAICTAAFEVPDFIAECSDSFGCQCIVMSIDVMGGNTVMTNCGKRGYNHDPAYTADWANRFGAGEILLTSIDREGTLQGYDLDLIRTVSKAVDVPVIANGGCGTYEHMAEAIRAGASAVAAGAMFQFTEATPRGAAEYLAKQGIEVRL